MEECGSLSSALLSALHPVDGFTRSSSLQLEIYGKRCAKATSFIANSLAP